MQLIKEEITSFENLPKIIESYVADIPEAAIDRKRSPDAWTIREHVYHIADVQEMLLERMHFIRETDYAVIEPFSPENEQRLSDKYDSIRSALLHYAALRTEQLSLLEQCSSVDFTKSAEHKEYSQYSIPVIVKHMIFHEYWHMYRIEELWLTNDEYFK